MAHCFQDAKYAKDYAGSLCKISSHHVLGEVCYLMEIGCTWLTIGLFLERISYPIELDILGKEVQPLPWEDHARRTKLWRGRSQPAGQEQCKVSWNHSAICPSRKFHCEGPFSRVETSEERAFHAWKPIPCTP